MLEFFDRWFNSYMGRLLFRKNKRLKVAILKIVVELKKPADSKETKKKRIRNQNLDKFYQKLKETREQREDW